MDLKRFGLLLPILLFLGLYIIFRIPSEDLNAYLPITSGRNAPEATPRSEKVYIDGYSILDRVSLDNGLPTAMYFVEPDGRLISSTWAKAISAKSGDVPSAVFNFDSGTIYSLQRQFPMLLGHSGSLKGGKDLFAEALNKAVAYDANSQLVNLAKGKVVARQLIGSEVVLCQSRSPNDPKPLERFNPADGCPGEQVRLVVTSATLLVQDKVAEYEGAVRYEQLWLLANEPQGKFERMVPGKSMFFLTCVTRLADQPALKSVPDYGYNRLLLGLTVRE